MRLCRKLTGLQITNVATGGEAMRRLLNTGVKTVVISSTELGCKDTLLALASTVTGMMDVLFTQKLSMCPSTVLYRLLQNL